MTCLKSSSKKITFILFLVILFFVWRPVFGANFRYVSPDKIKDLESGAEIETSGVVVVGPMVLGKQFFYINGVQIYSYKKDFPDLTVGDEISVRGIISKCREETRIKTKTRDDIKILRRGLEIEPQLVGINNINPKLVGRLIKISGQVIEKTGLRIFVDDGNGEIVVYLKEYAKIDKSRIREGDEVEIVGILSRSNDELRLLPRGNQDIEIVQKLSEPDSDDNQNNWESDSLILASSGGAINFDKFKPYLILSSIILGIIFILLLVIKKYVEK